VSRRSLLLPAVLCALAIPVAPALAGEDDPDSGDSAAKLHMSQGCVSGSRTKLAVTGSDIDSVTYFVDGKRIKRVTTPTSKGRFVISMRCAKLHIGANRGRAVVNFEAGASRASRTLRFQLTRGLQSSPRFTG
jgi:hypothetical protein